MCWRDGVDYPKDRSEFTIEQKATITPEQLVRWMKHRIYDDPDADADIDRPKLRASTILFWKKAISHFMPNKRTDWNELANVGNPTRSNPVNDLIVAIKRKETARLGAPPQARRALFASEFEQAIEMMEQFDDWEVSTFCVAYFRFQLHFIARGDDSAKLRLPEIKPFHQYPAYGIEGRLCWSKNVHEDRDAPMQLMVGSMDRRYDVLIGLALWLEYHFTHNPGENEFVFGIYGEEDPKTIKEHAYDALKSIFTDGEFNPVDDGKKGTHSMRKFGCDLARGNGCSKDDTDHRARWKGSDRQQDDYTSTTIPYVDGKVAFALCKGGAVYYMQKQESGMTDQWILDYVVPNLKHRVPHEVAIVLGRALLWQCCDESAYQVVPPEIRQRIEDASSDLVSTGRYTVPDGENPVSKIPLICDGVDAQLIIEEAFADEEGEDDGNTGIGGGANNNNDAGRRVRRRIEKQEMRMLATQIVHLRREVADARAEHSRDFMQVRRDLGRMNGNVLRIAQTPGRRCIPAPENNPQPAAAATHLNINNTNGDTNQQPLVASLTRVPRTLHELWTEWNEGYPASGKKAVKDFTKAERGKVKHTYYKRKFFWHKCAELVRSGMTAQSACDKIQHVYGDGQSVTYVLERMKRDHIDTNGRGHPQLRNVQI